MNKNYFKRNIRHEVVYECWNQSRHGVEEQIWDRVMNQIWDEGIKVNFYGRDRK